MIQNAIELTMLPGVGSLTQNRIWKAVPDIAAFFSMETNALASLGVPKEAFAVIRSRGFQAMAAEIYDWGRGEGCHFLLRGDGAYPPLLNELFDPPLILYARGQMKALDQSCVAIVGTRKPSIYGLQMAQGLAHDLFTATFVVVP